MTIIYNIKSEIEQLDIIIDKTITIQVFNFLDLSFALFLSILSHEARKKKKLSIFKSLNKLLGKQKFKIKNQDKAIANYRKQFVKKR